MDLEARVKALEDLLSLPSDAAARNPQSDVLADKVATLEAALAKANYRIKHLAAAYDAKAAEVEALKRAGSAGAASKTA